MEYTEVICNFNRSYSSTKKYRSGCEPRKVYIALSKKYYLDIGIQRRFFLYNVLCYTCITDLIYSLPLNEQANKMERKVVAFACLR